MIYALPFASTAPAPPWVLFTAGATQVGEPGNDRLCIRS